MNFLSSTFIKKILNKSHHDGPIKKQVIPFLCFNAYEWPHALTGKCRLYCIYVGKRILYVSTMVHRYVLSIIIDVPQDYSDVIKEWYFSISLL